MCSVLLLKNSSYFDVKSGCFNNNFDILIENDRIKSIKDNKIEFQNQNIDKIIDCTDKYILPGLFECHTHLIMLTKQGDEKLHQVLEQFVKSGITQIRDLGGPLNLIKKISDQAIKNNFSYPDIFFSGPLLEKSPVFWKVINDNFPDFSIGIDTIDDVSNILKELKSAGASVVKTFGKFDLPIYKFLCEKAGISGLRVTHDTGKPTIFHSIPVDSAIDAGVDCFEHVKALWSPSLKPEFKEKYDDLINRQSDADKVNDYIELVLSKGFESIDEEKLDFIIDKIIDNDVYICPTLHISKLYADKYYKDQDCSENEKENLRKKFQLYQDIYLHFTDKMAGKKVKILVGQDGFTPEYTINEMMLLKEAGLSNAEIIKGSTFYPSEWLGITDKYGSISENKIANIIILNSNPLSSIANIKDIYKVIKNGKIVN